LEVEALDGDQGPPGPQGPAGPPGAIGPHVALFDDPLADLSEPYLGFPQQIGLPAGANKQVQFNNAGALGGASNFTFDPATGQVAHAAPISGDTVAITALASTNGILVTPASGSVGLKVNGSSVGDVIGVIAQSGTTGDALLVASALGATAWSIGSRRSDGALVLGTGASLAVPKTFLTNTGTLAVESAPAGGPAIQFGGSGVYAAAVINRGVLYYDTAGGSLTLAARSSGGSTNIKFNVSNAGTDSNVGTLDNLGRLVLSSDYGAGQGMSLQNTNAADGRTVMRWINNRTTSQTWDLGIDTGGGATKAFGLRDITNAHFPWSCDINGQTTFGGAITVPYAPGNVVIATGTAMLTSKRVQLTGSQRLQIVGTGRLRIM